MTPRTWLAIACLVGGVVLAAYALSQRQLLLALVGFALVFTFIYLLSEAMTKAAKSTQKIIPAEDAAWKLKDAPASDRAPGGDREVR